jgi:MFS family permease
VKSADGITGRLGSDYRKLVSASIVSNLGDGIALIAYPWLASALTRNPILISLVAVVQRLPWLLFSLPAGVITDRVDRRSLMVWSNIVRTGLTVGVAIAVLDRQGVLPGPDEVEAATTAGTDLVLYAMVLVATLLLGMAEVLYDNAGQTLMPAIVEPAQLERANGRLWSAEQIANSLAGPPLGAVLLAVAFSVPFFVDAASFAISAALIAAIPTARRVSADAVEASASWRADLVEGVRWLWGHDLLRPMAVILGLLNMLGLLSGAALVLFAQEILGTTPTEFALLGTGGAVGGILGGWLASAVSERIGAGPSLALTLIGGAVTSILIGLTSSWPVAWLMMTIFMFLAVLWNVITVSLRQTIIPDHLLGRVNSVYRFFAWGMMPIGALLGGLIIAGTEAVGSRELALRMPWLVAGVGQLALFSFAAPRLTSAKMHAARTAAEGPQS